MTSSTYSHLFIRLRQYVDASSYMDLSSCLRCEANVIGPKLLINSTCMLTIVVVISKLELRRESNIHHARHKREYLTVSGNFWS